MISNIILTQKLIQLNSTKKKKKHFKKSTNLPKEIKRKRADLDLESGFWDIVYAFRPNRIERIRHRPLALPHVNETNQTHKETIINAKAKTPILSTTERVPNFFKWRERFNEIQ